MYDSILQFCRRYVRRERRRQRPRPDDTAIWQDLHPKAANAVSVHASLVNHQAICSQICRLLCRIALTCYAYSCHWHNMQVQEDYGLSDTSCQSNTVLAPSWQDLCLISLCGHSALARE